MTNTTATGVVTTAQSFGNLKHVLDNLLRQVTKGDLNYESVMQMKEDYKILSKQHGDLKREHTKMKKQKAIPAHLVVTGEPGAGLVKEMEIAKLFGIPNHDAIPTITWENPHPLVEMLDDNYQPDLKVLTTILEGISLNLNTWIYGPTGCGKDAAINYVSAKTGLPVYRISCDADISRAELIGRDKLEGDGKGGTKSTMIEGLLVKALKQPCLLVLDEIDFMREDVAYVLQTVLNEGKLTLLENGGEIIHRNPLCHVIATANTNGLTDPLNMYPGSRQQSAAFLDRFNNWVAASYMDDYTGLIADVSGFTPAQCKPFNAFVHDYHRMFFNGDIRTPLSNRAILTISEKASTAYGNLNFLEAFQLGIESTLLARLEESEHPRIVELMNKRVKA